MEGLLLLIEGLVKEDYMCKIYLKDTYFSVPLDPNSQEFIRFRWKGQIYVSMPILWVRPSIQVIHQTAKNSILTSEEIECLINYFSGLYSSGGSVSTRDSLIFLLQNLVFLINLKKSILHPTQKIPYLRIRIKSVEMTIALPQEKKIRFYISVSLLKRSTVPITEFTKFID